MGSIRFLTIIFVLGSFSLLEAQNFELKSKDNNTVLTVSIKNGISWSVDKYNSSAIEQVNVNMNLDGKNLVDNPRVVSEVYNEINEMIVSVVPQKRREIENSYKELVLQFKDDYKIEFRVYDEAIAYRFVTMKKGDIEVFSETMDLSFPKNTISYFPKEENMYSHYEREYLVEPISDIEKGEFSSLPVLFAESNNIKVLFSEADLYDYPNLFLQKSMDRSFNAIFPKVVQETKPLPSQADRSEIITKEAGYIAKTVGNRTFPWRVFIISNDDKTFIENDMVFKLSRPLELNDVSWIKPGKAAWDWYNANNIYDVNFKSGLNTETYMYYIDFAAQFGLEYVILDEGWTESTTEILKSNQDLDVKKLIAYGKDKGVDIILWCLWKPLDNNLVEILDTYSSWGAKGIKVDFMQRADQYMVNSYTKIAKETAKRHLLVDFHGAFKPSGLRRAYPNVISREGVKGGEHNKFVGDYLTPTHNVTLPFIRMAVGPMDYTPGAMRNGQKENYSKSFERPMSMGTRAHQAAMYVVFESALQMLCDSPSSYLKDKKTIEIISKIPTTWDETIALDAKVGEYIAVARRKGGNWYYGAMTNFEERNLKIDFSFLPAGEYEATFLKDGVNANRYAEDYKIEKIAVTPSTILDLKLAKGGGCVAIITKK